MDYLIRFHEAGREAQPQRHKIRRDIVASVAAKLPDAAVTAAVGRVFVESAQPASAVLQVLAQLYGVTSYSPCTVCSRAELTTRVADYASHVLPGTKSYRLTVKCVDAPDDSPSQLARTLGSAIARRIPGVKVDLGAPALEIGIEVRKDTCRVFHEVIPGREIRDVGAPVLVEPRLLVDQMLGHLVTWLRLLGFDTAYVRDHPDTVLLRMAEEEGRAVITRDGPLARVRAVNTMYVESDDPSTQLREVIETLGLRVRRTDMFTRCTLCNDAVEPVAKNRIKERIPEVAYQSYDEFTMCRACDKVYWKGGQYQHIIENLTGLIDES